LLTRSSQRQPLQIFLELIGELRPLERELNRRLQHAELIACIEALALKRVAEDLLLFDEGEDAVGELNLSTSAGLGLREQFEDARRENVAAPVQL
jgi:hypothetical protein